MVTILAGSGQGCIDGNGYAIKVNQLLGICMDSRYTFMITLQGIYTSPLTLAYLLSTSASHDFFGLTMVDTANSSHLLLDGKRSEDHEESPRTIRMTSSSLLSPTILFAR